jgi:hypothetical protein
VGGSDYHRAGELWGGVERQLGSPVNWVYVPGEVNQSAILSAIRAGHVTLSDEPDGPFLLIIAGDGFLTLPGDTVTLEVGGHLHLRMKCQGGAGFNLRLWDQNGVVFEKILPAQDYQEEIDLELHESLFIRAELRTPDGHMSALTNPIYILYSD